MQDNQRISLPFAFRYNLCAALILSVPLMVQYVLMYYQFPDPWIRWVHIIFAVVFTGGFVLLQYRLNKTACEKMILFSSLLRRAFLSLILITGVHLLLVGMVLIGVFPSIAVQNWEKVAAVLQQEYHYTLMQIADIKKSYPLRFALLHMQYLLFFNLMLGIPLVILSALLLRSNNRKRLHKNYKKKKAVFL